MPKRGTFDEDDDYKNIRPGNIDDIFEEDDSLEFNEIDDTDYESEENYEYSSDDETDKMIDEEEIIDEGFNEHSFEEVANEIVEEEKDADSQKVLDDLLESSIDDSIETEDVYSTESVDNISDEETKTVEEESNEGYKEFDPLNDVDTEDDYEPELNDFSEDDSESVEEDEVVIESEEKEDEIEITIKDDETESVEENSTDNEVKIEEIIKTDEEFDDSMYTKSSDQFMKDSFYNRIKEITNRYTVDQLVGYINKYKSADDRNLFKDIFISNKIRYSQYLDFEDVRIADDFWILAAGLFADHITARENTPKKDETYVVMNEKFHDKNLIEDPAIIELKKNKASEALKYSKYKIDRSIFNIADSEDEETSSVFDDKKTLEKDFYEGPFYGILKEVMESDRMADMTLVKMTVTINEDTAYIPVVDFNTGVRVICIDTEDVDQYHLSPLLLSRKIPFAFTGSAGRSVKTRMLYSDACKDRPVAVIAALKKIVAFKFIKNKYKITLNHNYVIAYTTDRYRVADFDNGDKDTKQAGSSTYCTTKPRTNCIGVIVLDKKSLRDRQNLRRNQVRNDCGQQPEEVNLEDYTPQFVLSAHYICNPQKLRDPTLTKDQRYVEYIITQYNECNNVIIMDGLQVITAAIIKEHMENFEPGTKYAISFEFDRDNLTSPSIYSMLDARDGLEPSLLRRTNMLDVQSSFILPPSRRNMGSGCLPCEVGRLDVRYFSPKSIEARYKEYKDYYSRYDLSTRDGRNEFIRSRGFEEFLSPAPVTFDIMPYALIGIENSDLIHDIQKISINALRDRNSDDSDRLRFKQRELEYFRSLGNNTNGTFQKFLFTVADFLFDKFSKN